MYTLHERPLFCLLLLHEVTYCARNIPITCKERQIRFDLLLSFSQVIARLHVEMKDKALHPFAVASLCTNRIMSPPHHITASPIRSSFSLYESNNVAAASHHTCHQGSYLTELSSFFIVFFIRKSILY
jgi:hypothetical protein